MEKNKVSIVVGVYNSDKFLRKGLDSIANQSWKNIEVIMVDDGSTDSSGDICEEYSKSDSRFTVIHKENSGVCDSRNIGIDMATGDYICFVDGDDWLEEDFVQYMMELIDKTKADMVLSDHLFTSFDREQIKADQFEIWNAEKTITRLIYPYMILGPWNKMYSMRIIKENGIKFPEHWFGETLHFASTVAYYSRNVGVGHRKVYDYRLDNINSGTSQFNVPNRLLSLDNAINLEKTVFAHNKYIMNAIKWHLHSCYFTLLINIIGSNERENYEKEYKNAIMYLKNNGLSVFFRSRVGVKEKIRIAARTICPRIYAKRVATKMLARIIDISESSGA